MKRLVRVKVSGLLGRFNHEVDFPSEWEFLILHGPNGVGKTRLLELISHTMNLRSQRLIAMPFENAMFSFTDGTHLEVFKSGQPELQLDLEDDTDGNVPSVTYRLRGIDAQSVTWTVHASDQTNLSVKMVRELERFLPIEQVGPESWMDIRTGDLLRLPDVLEQYGEELPLVTRQVSEPVPTQLQSFVADLEVHLIETQRLLALQDFRPRSGSRRRGPAQQPTVAQFADDLSRRIREALAANSRRSQELDRTFPRRVLTQNIPESVTDDQIRSRYSEQSDLRKRLAEIAILDPSHEVEMPLSSKSLEDWERRVLWTYLDDSEKKLATFSWLLDRIDLMREIVNSRFLFKDLQIDAEQGFRFISQDNGGELGPLSLSSGEQHEIVLIYDLLFNVESNSLVLIDEPEISLHVAWQQEFLNDLQQIATLGDLRFVVATHSPQIIHTWHSRAHALYSTGDTRRD